MKQKMFLLVLAWGFLMGVTCYAQSSCSHTITIRIIQPNTFEITEPQSVQSDTQVLNLEEEGGVSRLKWKTDSEAKKVTVSAPSEDLLALRLLTNSETIDVTPSPQELIVTEPGSAGFLDVQVIPAITTEMSKRDNFPVIAYTITDAT